MHLRSRITYTLKVYCILAMCKLISTCVPMFLRTNLKKMFLRWYKNYKGGHMIYPQSFKVSLMHTNFASLAKQQGLKRTSSPHVLNFFHRHWEPAFFCQKMSKEVGERKKHRKTLEIMILLLLLRRRHSTRKHGFLLRVLYSASGYSV